jgi:hypothetical protein
MSFPPHDIFLRQASALTEKLTNEQLKKTIDDIKLLDQDGLNNLYRIIRYSAHIADDKTVYNGNFRKNVIFDMCSIPDILQKMIHLFVQKHLEETYIPPGNVDIVFE